MRKRRLKIKRNYFITCVLLPVGMYSSGNVFVVYEISKHVLPTAPSPTTTHLIFCIEIKIKLFR